MIKNKIRLLAAGACCALALPAASDAQDNLSAAFVYVGPVGDAGWT
jgi:basic membrane lipoprotein Med (substrate-binding protein (PBP1-ABC) superfamily)